jgi:hypothetical protein
MASKIWTTAELIAEGALNTVEYIYSHGKGFVETLEALRARFGEQGTVRPSVAKTLFERMVAAHNAAANINSGNPPNPGDLPLRNDLVSNYRYSVVISINCPDGTSDSYPVYVDSDEPLEQDEILALANRTIDNLIASKYQRMAKFDVNRRLGEPCTESVEIVEAWQRG